MECFINMGLAGSLMWILYSLIRLLAQGKLREKYRYLMLKAVLCYYLIPIPFVKKIYSDIWKRVIVRNNIQQVIVKLSDNKVVYIGDQMYFSPALQWKAIWGAILAVMAAAVLFYRAGKYIRHRKILLRCRLRGSADPKSDEECKVLQRKFGIRKNIVYIDSTPADEKGNTAFTLGIIRPVIVYPAMRSVREKELILEHELQHVRNWDVLWRLLLDIAGIMHFYNPLVWFFAAEFETVSEMVCDAEVIGKRGEQERREYAGLLIQMAQSDTKKTKWSAGIGGKKNKIKERVEHIMKRDQRYFGKAVSAVLVGTAIFISSFTAFAYDDVDTYHIEDMRDREKLLQGELEFIPDGADYAQSEFLSDIIDLDIKYDRQFMDEAGNIYEISDETVSTMQICSHHYVDGMIEEHIRNDAGGCTVTVYDAQRCIKCGNVVVGQEINMYIYKICTH